MSAQPNSKDFKLAIKRGCDSALLEEVLNYLVNEKALPEKYRDHSLQDSRLYKDVRGCHIQPDWLLIYHISNETLVLHLIRTGTHSDLFR